MYSMSPENYIKFILIKILTFQKSFQFPTYGISSFESSSYEVRFDNDIELEISFYHNIIVVFERKKRFVE